MVAKSNAEVEYHSMAQTTYELMQVKQVLGANGFDNPL